MIFPPIIAHVIRPLGFSAPLKFASALLVLNLACSCESLHVAPSEGPARIESWSAITSGRNRARAATPALSLSIAPTTINAGASATYTVSSSRRNPSAALTVNFAMGGTAVPGTHYSLDGSPAQLTIPAGVASANLVLSSVNSGANPGKKTATMTLQAGSGYKLSTSNKSTVTIVSTGVTPTPSPTPTPTPTPTPIPTPTATPSPSPNPTPTQDVWILIRTDGTAGSGTQADPYDGSTMAKFDALMDSFQSTSSLGIHLGPGMFRTNAAHTWYVRSGWVVDGAGIDVTFIQLGGNASGKAGVGCFLTDPNLATNSVTISNMTVDCNWAELSATANAGVGGEKNIKTGVLFFYGSNNLIDHVRSINSYGSAANHKEQFTFFVAGPRNGDGDNNVIQFCRAEQPQGNYGSPYALAGWINSMPFHLITNSKVVSCTATGLNDGQPDGFTTGGVNLANVKDCWIEGNIFTDCYAASYQDTGSCDGLHVINNTLVRGWEGVGLSSPTLPKQNIEIRSNNFLIQNRALAGGSYGIVATDSTTTNVMIDSNTIKFDKFGQGMAQFWGVSATLLTTATISNNTIDQTINSVSGIGLSMFNNLDPAGLPIPGLGN